MRRDAPAPVAQEFRLNVGRPVGKVEAFEHQVKQHVRQARWQQNAGIQNNQGVATGREWVAVYH